MWSQLTNQFPSSLSFHHVSIGTDHIMTFFSYSLCSNNGLVKSQKRFSHQQQKKKKGEEQVFPSHRVLTQRPACWNPPCKLERGDGKSVSARWIAAAFLEKWGHKEWEYNHFFKKASSTTFLRCFYPLIFILDITLCKSFAKWGKSYTQKSMFDLLYWFSTQREISPTGRVDVI